MTPVEAEAAMTAHVDQLEATERDLARLLELLRPLAGSRGPVWWVLRRLPPQQRAEVRDLRARLGMMAGRCPGEGGFLEGDAHP